MKNKPIIIAGILITILVAGFFYNRYRVTPQLNLNQLALTDLNGAPVGIESFEGKKLFINFFATWCGPCIKELPSIYAAQQTMVKSGFVFILISDEPVERLKKFSGMLPYPLYILHSQKPLQQYSIYTIPASYILSSSHRVVYSTTGGDDWAGEKMMEKFNAAE